MVITKSINENTFICKSGRIDTHLRHKKKRILSLKSILVSQKPS